MNSPKLNETKADKEPLGKIFWFLWLPWFVLLLLIILIALYQKEGIFHQDDLATLPCIHLQSRRHLSLVRLAICHHPTKSS